MSHKQNMAGKPEEKKHAKMYPYNVTFFIFRQ